MADTTFSGDAAVKDGTTLAANQSLFNVVGGVYNDSVPDLSTGDGGMARLTQSRAIHVNLRDATGGVVESFGKAKSGTATLSTVAGSVTSVTLQAANTNRLGLSIHNDSTSVLYVKLGTPAGPSSFTVRMVEQAHYEVPFDYTGIVTGEWVTGTGAARVTELT